MCRCCSIHALSYGWLVIQLFSRRGLERPWRALILRPASRRSPASRSRSSTGREGRAPATITRMARSVIRGVLSSRVADDAADRSHAVRNSVTHSREQLLCGPDLRADLRFCSTVSDLRHQCRERAGCSHVRMDPRSPHRRRSDHRRSRTMSRISSVISMRRDRSRRASAGRRAWRLPGEQSHDRLGQLSAGAPVLDLTFVDRRGSASISPRRTIYFRFDRPQEQVYALVTPSWRDNGCNVGSWFCFTLSNLVKLTRTILSKH